MKILNFNETMFMTRSCVSLIILVLCHGGGGPAFAFSGRQVVGHELNCFVV